MEHHPDYLSYSAYRQKKRESYEDYMLRAGPILELFEVPSNSSEKWTHTYITETHRIHMKAMISFVIDMHKKGKSLKYFDESNLVMEGDKLKFHGLESIDSLSRGDAKRDYKSLYDIIANLKRKHNPKNYVCKSLDDLLFSLKISSYWFEFAGVSHEEFEETTLLNHLALLSHEESLQRIKSFDYNSKFIHEGEDRNKYFDSLMGLRRSRYNLSDWTQDFRERQPELGPTLDCFHYKQPPVNEEDIRYKGTGSKATVNRSILRFCRNMVEHLPDHMLKYKPDYDQRDIDLTIMALFETELLSFQRQIFENGISHYFITVKGDTPDSAGQSPTSDYAGGRSQAAFTQSSSKTTIWSNARSRLF